MSSKTEAKAPKAYGQLPGVLDRHAPASATRGNDRSAFPLPVGRSRQSRMLARLSFARKGCDHSFANRDEACARPFNASTLAADAGAFEQKRQGIRKQIRFCNSGTPTKFRQAIALVPLELFNDMQTWKIALGTSALAAIAIAVVVVRQGDALFGGTAGAAIPNPAAFAMPVPVANIVKKTIPISLDYSARTESIRNVALQAKVSGFIQQQHIADGTDVKEGDLLYTIDPRDFQAALDQAKAQAQRNIAALEYARSNLDRGSTLAQSGYLAKDTLDQRSSAARQAEATFAMDQAAIRTAELNLSYTQIRAPFSGRLGRNQASVGTLIGTTGTPLNTLVQLDPIYVTFNPSETDLAMISRCSGAS